MKCADVANATVKIQKVYRGFHARKQVKESKEDMPDLKCADVANAAVKIQKVYRGFQARKQVKELEDMPDLKSADVAMAAVKIQKVLSSIKTNTPPSKGMVTLFFRLKRETVKMPK